MRFNEFKIPEAGGRAGRRDALEQSGQLIKSGPPFPPEDTPVVKEIQTKLEELGYSVGMTGIDGKYGPRTVRAIRAWKDDNRLRGTAFELTIDEVDLLMSSEPIENPSHTGNSLSKGSTAGTAKPTDDTLTMIKGFEGFQPKAYWDYKQYSIGYGSKADSKDQEVTEKEAEEMLIQQLEKYVDNVNYWNKKGGYNWNEGQKGALISFAYNIGSIKQLTDNGRRDNATIAKKMLQYVNAGGKKIAGLVTRRKIEQQKFVMNTPGLGSGI